MDLTRLLKLVEAKRPETYKKLTADPDNVDEKLVIEAVAEILEDEESKKAADPESKRVAEGDSGAAAIDKDELQRLISEAVKTATAGVAEQIAEERAKIMAAGMIAEAALPDEARKRAQWQVDQLEDITREKVAEAITAEADYLRRHTSWVGPGSTAGSGDPISEARIRVDEKDKWDAAFQGFFAGEDQEIQGEDGKSFKQPRYQSIREAYVDFTGDVEVTGEFKDAVRLSEAAIASGSWAGALGDNLNKAMQREYKVNPYSQWRLMADVVPVKDFRSNYRPQLGGFSGLSSVAENAAYGAFTTEPDDFTPSYSVTKYGATQVISMETIINDDVGAVRRLPRKMARAAARTLNTNVWSPVLNNSNVSWEAVALAAAAHGNNVAVATLTPANIIAGRTTMMKQTEPQSGERLNIPPRYVAVPVDLEASAFEYSMSAGKPILATSDTNAAAGTATTGTIENQQLLNIIRSWNLIPVVVPHWTATTKWWLLADKADIPMMEVGFLGGREEPELFSQDLPNVGSMFTNDQLTYKVRQIYGTVVLDYRGFYYGNG